MAPLVDDDLGDTCVWCGNKDVDLTCSRCRAVIYCGRQCQRAHWPGHKAECARLVREASARSRAPASTLTPAPEPASASAGDEEERRKAMAEALRKDLKKEAEEQFRQQLDRINKERLQAAKKATAERLKQKRQEAFQRFLESLRRCLLPRLPPCGPRDKVPVIVCGPAKAVQRRVEPAGMAFHELYERTMDSFRAPADKRRRRRQASRSRGTKREASASGARSSRSFSFAEARSKYHMHKARPSPSLAGIELFTLLGLEMNPGYSPSQDDIKEAYRKLALACHPDKADSKGTDAMVLIQSAYDFLADIENKEIYESTLPFDDSMPSEERISERGFFKVLRPVFKRNSKWSVHQPVPDLGEASTPMEEVREFYRFWYDFTSWRDVSPKFLKTNDTQLEDIYDCPRQERREKQKHNVSIRKKFEVHERLRITKLVNLAWKHDPRLEEVRRRGRKKDEEEADEDIEDQDEEEQLSEGERRRREAEEAAAEEERQKEQQIREEQRQAAKKRRARLRKVVEELGLRVDPDELQRLCYALGAESMEALTEEVERLGTLALQSESSGDGGEDLGGSQDLERSERGEEEADSGHAEKKKTPKQLAQEAIFEAMHRVGIEPTETQLSPEEAEALERAEAQAKEQAERARRERAKKRREEEKEERRRRKEEDYLEEQSLMEAQRLQSRETEIKREIERLKGATSKKASEEEMVDAAAEARDQGEGKDNEPDGDVTGLESQTLEQQARVLGRLKEFVDLMKSIANIADQTWIRRTWRQELKGWEGAGVDEVWDELEEIEGRGVVVDSHVTARSLMKMVALSTEEEDPELMRVVSQVLCPPARSESQTGAQDLRDSQKALRPSGRSELKAPELAPASQASASRKSAAEQMSRVSPKEYMHFLENLLDYKREELILKRRVKKDRRRPGDATAKRGRKDEKKLQRQQEDEERQQQRLRQEQERQQRAEETAIRNANAERDLQALERTGDPATVERVQLLTDFLRIGGTAEAAREVARAAIRAAPQLSELLRSMEVHRLTDPEGYTDDVLGLLADFSVPFFELGVRPQSNAAKLPPDVRTKVKHARTALRNLVKKGVLAFDEEPDCRSAAPQAADHSTAKTSVNGAACKISTASQGKNTGARARSRARSSPASARRSGSRRQR